MLYFILAALTIVLCICSAAALFVMPLTHAVLRSIVSKPAPNAIPPPDEKPLLGEDSKDADVTPDAKGRKPSVSLVWRRIWREGCVVWTVFFVTLSLFPGITTLIPSSSDKLGDWFAVIMITIFMVGDFVGRSGPYLFGVPRVVMEAVAYARLVFFALFIVSALGYTTANAYSYVLMLVFALTNGYTGTLALMTGPPRVHQHEREVASIVLGFCLNFGIFVACNFSILLLYLVTGSVFPKPASDSSSASSL
eukprot:TRINITY_DN5120_c0_g1_i1.p2 TRINITY_DN5120_c0_g1~~TRINITY_DN5120_c0_g1_i1.p2  ORF type:complete len:260 (+),score=94.34 TRINITY_DN5120_c0_g1_i1:29-781(+)